MLNSNCALWMSYHLSELLSVCQLIDMYVYTSIGLVDSARLFVSKKQLRKACVNYLSRLPLPLHDFL